MTPVDDLRRLAAGFDCGECGQHVAPAEYHPFTYCVLHRAGVSIQQARDDLGAAAESQRETLDVETLTTVLATFDRQWPIEQRAGTYEIVEVDERTFAERIVAALKEQPRG